MATKQADVPNGRFWNARPAGETVWIGIFLECASFFDARAFAQMALGEALRAAGTNEVEVRSFVRPLNGPDWQVKWAGAGGSQTNPKHLVARRARKGERFAPVREIDFA